MTRRASLLLIAGVLALAVVLVFTLIVPREPEENAGTSDPGAVATTRVPAATDAPGTAILPEARPGAAPAPVPQPIQDEPAVVDDAVAAAASLRVIDRAGRPVSGATVRAHRVEGEGIVRTRRLLGPARQTDAEGRVRLERLPAGPALGVHVRAAGFAPGVRETFVLRADETQDLGDVVLDPGFPLTGRVADGAAMPIEAAEVEVAELGFFEGGDPDPMLVLTDAEGRYVVEHLGPRQYQVEARAEGHASDSAVLSLMLGGTTEGQRQDFRLLAADNHLAGLVLGPDDLPVPGCTVTASRHDAGRRTYASLETTAGEDGRWRFDALAEGSHQLGLHAPTHYLPRPVRVEAGRDDVVLRVQAGLSVHGQLVCDGEPPRRFDVRTLPHGPSGAGLLSGHDLAQRVTAADPPGSFTVAGLKPGSYRFEVAADGWAVTTSADVVIGHDGGDAELMLRLLRGGTISGRVDPADPGLAAELRGADYDPALPLESLFPTRPMHALVAPTGADGAFRIEHVPPGDYTLTLRGAGRPPVHVRGLRVEDEEPLDVGRVALPLGGTLLGNVLGPDGRERAGVRVTATSDSHHQEAVTDAHGAFRMAAVPDGDYDVVAVPANLWEALRFEARAFVAVRSGEEQPVLLRLAERTAPPR